jgi:hypothetical protein
LNQSLTLSEDGNYYLTFWHNYRLDPSFILWVEVSTDGGANWNWVGRYGSYDNWDNYSTGDFVQEVLDLDDYTGQAQVLLRFRFDWTAGWYYYGNWYLDDIKVFHIPAPAPVADFTADPTAGTAPLTVNFTDFSTGDITSWEWNFGDSGTSTAQDPSHIYNTTGAYTVSLTVTGPGGTDTETKIDYITVSTEGWEGAYDSLFRHPSDLTLLRQYRDEFLIKTIKGKLYTKLLYNRSEEALQVLLQNPELMMEAKHLIEANKDAVSDVLHGNEGVIYNTDEIVSFLKAYARKSPPGLKLLAITVEKEMLRQQRQGEKFLGFRLK